MRFISMVKSSEADVVMPTKEFLNAMDRLIQDAKSAGCVMVEAGGLFPTANGARVRLANGRITVMDGPFAEAKEVVGGYAIFEVGSKAEMLDWTRKFMELHREYLPGWEGEAEVRQLAGPGEKLCDQVRDAQPAAL